MNYLLMFVVISILIFLHELGHFLAAKWVGIPIARFSVGYGPKVIGVKARETEYWLAAVPFGGSLLQKLYNPLKRLQMPITVAGWVLLMSLMVYATILDIAKIAYGSYA